jgi:predicted nucleic acid-binding protein
VRASGAETRAARSKGRGRPRTFVLDTSAVLAFFEGEPGVAAVKDLLRRARRGEARALVSLMTVYEVLYVTSQEEGEEEGLRRVVELRSLPVEEVGLEPAHAIRAAHLKAARALSVADSWIAATAIEAGAVLVHKDPELLALADIVALETLPLK